MTVNKHPDMQFLLEYATGSLSSAPCIAVSTHLLFCGECRDKVDGLQQVGGELLSRTDASPVSDDLLASMLERLDTPIEESNAEPQMSTDPAASRLPTYVQNLLPTGMLKWRFLSPSIKVSPIPVGESQFELALHRMKAGGSAPTHDHQGSEITVVLLGSFSDEDGVYHAGDFVLRQPGDIHQPQATRHEECYCLSVLEGPIKLTGIKQLLNPLLGFSPS